MHDDYDDQRSRSGAGKIMAIGCGSVVVLMALSIAVGYWWVSTHAKNFGADVFQDAITQIVQESDLSADDQARLLARTDRLVAEFKTGEVTMKDLEQVSKRLVDSPLWVIGSLRILRENYIDTSGLSDDEKRAAVLQAQRFGHGLHDKKIPREEGEQALELISEPDGRGKQQLKETLTDEELRALIARFTAAADAAGVDDQPFDVDVAQEIIDAIDSASAH